MPIAPHSAFTVSAEVAEALQNGRPVVALESTIISHGLPRPRNHEAATEFEEVVKLAPDWRPGRINLAIALINVGRDPAA